MRKPAPDTDPDPSRRPYDQDQLADTIEHHEDCHYGPLYRDGQLCWQATGADRRAVAAIARYEECPYCGLACDGGSEEPLDGEAGQGPTSGQADRTGMNVDAGPASRTTAAPHLIEDWRVNGAETARPGQ